MSAPTLQSRIEFLLASGEGLSEQVIAAIVGVSVEDFAAALGGDTTVAQQGASGGGGASVRARSHMAAGTVLTNGEHRVPFDTVDFDIGAAAGASGFLTPYTYTCPVDGDYLVAGNAGVLASISGSIILYKNGVSDATGGCFQANGGYTAFPLVDVIHCVAGDTLELYMYNGSANATGWSSATHFAVTLLP